MIGCAGQWTQTPSTTALQPKNMKCSFLDCIHFWWSTGLIDELEPHLPLLSCQKNEMLIFWLRSTSDDQPGWSMDSKPICHPSPANKMKCSFWIVFTSDDQPGWLMDSNPSATSLQPKNEMLIFVLHSTSDVGQTGWWTQTPSTTPLQPKKWNASFLDYVHFWWSARLVDGLKPHLPPLSSQKMKCSFLDYVQLLMISQAGQWTQTPSTTPLQPKKWNAHFWITFNFWWSARLVNGLQPHLPPLSSQKNEMLFLDYVQLLMISWAGWGTQTPSSTSLQPKKWNAHFCIMFNF